MKRLLASIAAAGLLSVALIGPALANDKVQLCHRTASDSNPYVLIEIDQSALDAHLNNLPGHPAKSWKSDGTWLGVAHVEGDLKNDYLFVKEEAECEPGEEPSEEPSATPEVTPTPTPEVTPAPTPEVTPVPEVTPTPTPIVTPVPVAPETAPPTDVATDAVPASSTNGWLLVIGLLAGLSGAIVLRRTR
jgi:cell division protein FtsN